jgi:uncharacterized protein YciI
MRYVVLFKEGPNWNPDRSLYDQGEPIAGHLAAMKQRFDEGSLLLGGPLENGGGLAIFEVADERAALDLLAADPAVEAGIVGYTLQRLIPYFDVINATRTDATVEELAAQRRKA